MKKEQHITNEVLYEWAQQGEVTGPEAEHFHQCDLCQKRYQQIQQLFGEIREQAVIAPARSLWSDIESQLQQQNAPTKKGREKRWFAAVAALLMVIIGWQWLSQSQFQQQQRAMMALMHQSQQLESRLAQSSSFNSVSFEQPHLRQLLSDIDDALQQAYQQQLEHDVIQTLWQQRVEVLKQLLKTDENRDNTQSI